MLKRHAVEKRQLPKRIRSEMKTRELMFRESLRISMANLNSSAENERERLRRFQESEKQRYRAEEQRQEIKHKRQLEDLRKSFESTLRELEQLQNEKRKQLMEHETAKLQQLEEEHTAEFKQWKNNLKPRKQVCSFKRFNWIEFNFNTKLFFDSGPRGRLCQTTRGTREVLWSKSYSCPSGVSRSCWTLSFFRLFNQTVQSSFTTQSVICFFFFSSSSWTSSIISFSRSSSSSCVSSPEGICLLFSCQFSFRGWTRISLKP